VLAAGGPRSEVVKLGSPSQKKLAPSQGIPSPFSYYRGCYRIIPYDRPPPRRSRSAAVPRLPMLPHLRWVWLQSDVKDHGSLRDGENRWGKNPSALSNRPWGASVAEIDAILP
jgi:hypothetical protein